MRQLGASDILTLTIFLCLPTLPPCRGLPAGALDMTEHYINAAPSCVRTPQELQGVIAEALQKLGAGSPAGAAV